MRESRSENKMTDIIEIGYKIKELVRKNSYFPAIFRQRENLCLSLIASLPETPVAETESDQTETIKRKKKL